MRVFALTLDHRQGLLSAVDRDRGRGSIPVPTADRRAWRVHAQDLLRVDADHWQGASYLQTLSLLYHPVLVWRRWPFFYFFHYSYKRIKPQNNLIILHLCTTSFPFQLYLKYNFFILVKGLKFPTVSFISAYIIRISFYFLKPIASAKLLSNSQSWQYLSPYDFLRHMA